MWTLNPKTGELEFDGHLNVYSKAGGYDDASEGLRLDYRKIGSFLAAANENNGTVELSPGVAVQSEALRKAYSANRVILSDSATRNSAAIAFLRRDGHMSYSEAKKAETLIVNRGLVLNRAEHYSVRFVLNAVGVAELYKDSQFTRRDKKKHKGFVLYSEAKSAYHGPGAYKWCHPDGREIVMSADKKFETRDEYEGTYNFAWKKGHDRLDMRPYFDWGNTPLDATPYGQRVAGLKHGKRIGNGRSADFVRRVIQAFAP